MKIEKKNQIELIKINIIMCDVKNTLVKLNACYMAQEKTGEI